MIRSGRVSWGLILVVSLVSLCSGLVAPQAGAEPLLSGPVGADEIGESKLVLSDVALSDDVIMVTHQDGDCGYPVQTYPSSVTASVRVTDVEGAPVEGVEVSFGAGLPLVAGSSVGVTDADGHASTVVTVQNPETVDRVVVSQVMASAAGLVSATSVSVETQMIATDYASRFTVEPTVGSVVAADGASSWTGRIELHEPRCGEAVDDAATGAFHFVFDTPGVDVSAVTNLGGGVYEVRFTSTVPGMFAVEVDVPGAPVWSPEWIRFVDPSQSRVTLGGLVLSDDEFTVVSDGDGCGVPATVSPSSMTASVQVTDSSGDPVGDVEVNFAADAPLVVADGVVVTDVNGRVSVAVSLDSEALASGPSPSVRATVGDQVVEASVRVDRQWVVTDYASSFTVQPTVGSSVVADGVSAWVGVIHVVDHCGRDVVDADVSRFHVVSDPVGVVASPVVNRGGGDYEVRLTSTVPGVFGLDVVAPGAPIWSVTRVNFVAPPQPQLAGVVVSDDVMMTTEYADGCGRGPVTSPSSVTVSAKVVDDAGDPAQGVDVSFMADTTLVLSSTTATTDESGVATVAVRLAADAPHSDATAQVSAMLGDQVESADIGLEFDVVAVDYASSFTVEPTVGSSVEADGVASWTGRVQLRDTCGRDDLDADVTDFLFVSDPAGVVASGVENVGGSDYVVRFTSSTAGSFHVVARVPGAPVWHPVELVFDSVVPGRVSLTAPADGERVTTALPLLSGVSTVTPVEVRDKDGVLCVTDAVDEDGAWACLPSRPLTEGTQALTIVAGVGPSTVTTEVTITVDTAIPVQPVDPNPSDPSPSDPVPTPSPSDGDPSSTPGPSDTGHTPTSSPSGESPTPTPTPSRGSQTPTPTPTGGEASPTGAPVDTLSPTPSETGTPSPSQMYPETTPSASDSVTPSPTPSASDSVVPSPTPSDTATATPPPASPTATPTAIGAAHASTLPATSTGPSSHQSPSALTGGQTQSGLGAPGLIGLTICLGLTGLAASRRLAAH